MSKKVLVLGINGRLGQEIAKAFVVAGYSVSGMGRENRAKLKGVRFTQGNADQVSELQAAIKGHEIVVNALNLPYDQWEKGRAEAMMARVIEAMGDSGRLLMFPGNVYNFSARQWVLTPSTSFEPEAQKGRIRVRMEQQLQEAASAGKIQLVILRSGDFYGPYASQSFMQVVIATRRKDKVLQIPHELDLPHSWAYLPDLAKAYVALAARADEFSASETFHFCGHFITGHELVSHIQSALREPWKAGKLPWGMLKVVGWFNPLMREVVKMRYLFQVPQQLKDQRLDEILGAEFGTPASEAIGATVRSYLPVEDCSDKSASARSGLRNP
ncbi:MAG: NAD-dependent epimerase/dehydratase family protein [Oceanobacter sp.]